MLFMSIFNATFSSEQVHFPVWISAVLLFLKHCLTGVLKQTGK